MNARLILGGALVLTLFALPALADPGGPAQDALAAIFAAAPGASCALPAPRETAGLPGPRTASDCTAHCWDGTTRTCSGSSCGANDSSCPSQRGNCWSDVEGYKYCPACSSSCSAWTSCSSGSPVFCQGTSGDCFSVYHCYAYCDGQYYLCSNPGQNCPP